MSTDLFLVINPYVSYICRLILKLTYVESAPVCSHNLHRLCPLQTRELPLSAGTIGDAVRMPICPASAPYPSDDLVARGPA